VTLGYGQGAIARLPNSLGFNGRSWGVGIFREVTGRPRVTVVNPDGWKLDNVPVPAAYAAYYDAMMSMGDVEHHTVIFDGDRVPNFYGTSRDLRTTYPMGLLRANGSGFWNNQLGPWLGRASGFCSATGAIRKAEMDAGRIDHALAVAWPKDLILPTYVSPASSSDGISGSGGIPMGSRLQLNPSLTDAQLKALGFPDYYLPVARAWQTYGAFVAESSNALTWAQPGRMALFAETWNDNGQVTYPVAFNHNIVSGLIPHLRVVAPPPAPVFDDRTVFGQPYR
jgi:hypothetical protein